MNRDFTRYQKLPDLDVLLVSATEPSDPPQGHGVRWLAGKGADTALASAMRVVRHSSSRESDVCPHPSPAALQDAGAPNVAANSFRA